VIQKVVGVGIVAFFFYYFFCLNDGIEIE